MIATGKCLCGIVKYELKSLPLTSGVCHCKNCQRSGGSAFSTVAAVNKNDLVIIEGELTLYSDSDTDSGDTVQRFFCDKCGSPIYSAVPSTPDIFYLKLGSMDDTSYFSPEFHVFCGSKQNWVQLGETIPASQKMENFG